jgi:gliding motility-associated-like protein
MVSFSWSPSATLNSATTPNPVATPPQTQTYSVIVTNRFGSSTTVAITVEVMEDFNIVANNILTPDGDGQNDLWLIENLSSYPVNKLIIFDRIGQVIYTKNNYANEWNGLFNGISLPEGTYYYVLSIKNGSSQKSGYITLVK